MLNITKHITISNNGGVTYTVVELCPFINVEIANFAMLALYVTLVCLTICDETIHIMLISTKHTPQSNMAGVITLFWTNIIKIAKFADSVIKLSLF